MVDSSGKLVGPGALARLSLKGELSALTISKKLGCGVGMAPFPFGDGVECAETGRESVRGASAARIITLRSYSSVRGMPVVHSTKYAAVPEVFTECRIRKVLLFHLCPAFVLLGNAAFPANTSTTGRRNLPGAAEDSLRLLPLGMRCADGASTSAFPALVDKEALLAVALGMGCFADTEAFAALLAAARPIILFARPTDLGGQVDTAPHNRIGVVVVASLESSLEASKEWSLPFSRCMPARAAARQR